MDIDQGRRGAPDPVCHRAPGRDAGSEQRHGLHPVRAGPCGRATGRRLGASDGGVRRFLRPVPSRAEGQYAIEGWLQEMLDDGWVVVATDYVAMGTSGTPLYLVGASEARDVVNSVRAARQVAGADAGTRWGVWGHSQGGHAALWTGALAASLAPELQLVGVAAAAPAAELGPLITQQWSNVVSWVIWPPVAVSWPIVHPGVTLEGVVTIGYLPLPEIEASKANVLTAAADAVMGGAGGVLLAVGAILATASAIDADYFGASKLPVILAEQDEAPELAGREVWGRHPVGLLAIMLLALGCAAFLDLHALSAAASAGFLAVFAEVNVANARIADRTGSIRAIPAVGAVACAVALAVLVANPLGQPDHAPEVGAIAMLAAIPFAGQWAYRRLSHRAAVAG